MPNHFQVIGLCGRDVERLEQLGKDDFDEIDLSPLEGANLCEIIAPLPEELSDIVATNPPVRYVDKTTGNVHQSVNGPIDDRERYDAMPLSSEEMEGLQAKYGASDWYKWQCDNWGTKWGTYALHVRELSADGLPLLIEFQSAWGPPNPDMMRLITDYLCVTYCFKDIRWLGHDPFDGHTLDIEVADTVPA